MTEDLRQALELLRQFTLTANPKLQWDAMTKALKLIKKYQDKLK
jgi:hypothetical protein